MRRVLALTTLTLALATVSACGGGSPWEGTNLDEPGWTACTNFAQQIRSSGGPEGLAALAPDARQGVVSAVADPAGRSTNPLIVDGLAVLTRTVEEQSTSWKLATDTFATRCLNAGWKVS